MKNKTEEVVDKPSDSAVPKVTEIWVVGTVTHSCEECGSELIIHT